MPRNAPPKLYLYLVEIEDCDDNNAEYEVNATNPKSARIHARAMHRAEAFKHDGMIEPAPIASCVAHCNGPSSQSDLINYPTVR